MTSIETATMRRPVLYRPESAVFWLFVVALVVGTVLLLADLGAVVNETLDAHATLAPLWLAFIAFMVWLMLRFDAYRAARAYPPMLVAGAALGGTVAIVMSIRGNRALEQLWALVIPPETLGRWSAALTAPIIEEAAKAACAAVVLVLCASVCTRPSHALLVGMFTGFGFDVVEDLSYATNEAIASLDSDLSGAGSQLFIRAVTAFPAHWSYTSLVTVGILLFLPWFANPADWSPVRRRLIAVGLLASGPVMHFIWNSPPPESPGGPLMAMVVKILINLAVFLIIAVALVRTERRWVSRRVAMWGDDVDPAAVTLVTSRRGPRAHRQLRRHLLNRIQAGS